MANTKSAKKALRVIARKTAINQRIRSDYKEAIRAVVDTVKSADKKKAQELLPKAFKKIDKAAKKFVLHKKTAARKKSRITKLVNSLS